MQVMQPNGQRKDINANGNVNVNGMSDETVDEEDEEYEGEESEYEGEEEEEEETAQEGTEDKAMDLFLEQQHRIVRRFSINAKITIADGAKFHQLINECNPFVISSFEVFALNRNEQDFLESLHIISDILKL